MSRLWLWLLALLLVAGLYTGIGFLWVPYYVTSNLPLSFQETTGMTLEPGKISFNPFSFRFGAKEAKILTETGPLLSLKSLSAELAPLSLLRRDLVSNAIHIEEIDLNITRESDGSYNFDQLLRRKKASDASDMMDFSDLPFFFSLNNIAIRNSKILFNDLPAGKTHTITDIQLDLPAFSNIPFRADTYIHPRFSAVINGSPVELTGQAHLGKQGEPSLVTDLSCELHELDLPTYSAYLPVDLPFLFKKGKADGTLDFHFNPEADDNDKFSVGFNLKIADTELQTPDESLLVAAPLAQLRGKLQPIAKTLHFTGIAFTEPAVSSYGDSYLKNINNLLKREKAPAAKEAESSHFVVATDALDFPDGSFRHYRKKESQKPELFWKLALQVKDYSSTGRGEDGKNFGSFNLSGEKEGANASFAWQGNFTSPENLKGSLQLANMEFSDLLKALGMEKKGFDGQGTAGLKGELAFPFTTDSGGKAGYRLNDGELAVENFKILENKQTILSAPLLKATGLSTAGKAIDWGNIFIQGGVAVFSASQTPGFFKDFNSDKNRVQGLDLEGQLTLVPEQKGRRKIQFNDVSLKAGNLQTPEKAKDNFSFTAQTSTGGTVSSRGDMRLVPFALSAISEFSGLAAEDFFPLLSDSEFFNSINGTLAGKGTLALPQQGFSGDLRLAKGQVLKGGKPLYSWEDSVFQGLSYTSKPFHLGITLAAVEQPEFTWQIDPKDDDPIQQLAAFFQQHIPEGGQASEKSKEGVSSVEIQEFRLADGRFRILDNRMKPRWQGQVTEFSGSITGIQPQTAEKTGSDFSFTGKLDEVPFSMEGSSLDLLAKNQRGRFRVQLDGYPLSAFHKQLAAKTDIDTKEGEFVITLDGMWQDGQYRNTGSLIFSGVKPVSEKADSALPMALLTGTENTFQLDFDLQRSTPAAKTSLAEEIISAWETKTVKAAVSPLLLASGDFGDLIGNEYAEFIPGESMLADKGREALSRYSTLLLSHPYLGLVLSGGIDKQLDGEAIRKQLEAVEQQRVDALNQKRLEDWQARKEIYEKKLQEPRKIGQDGKIVEITIPPDILAGFTPIQPEPVVVKDAMLLELAQKRLNVVYQYFTTQLALEEHRITLMPPKKLGDSENSVEGVKIGVRAIKR